MVTLFGYVLGALLMLGVASLLSIGVFVLPIALVLLGVGAVWANRARKARACWIAASEWRTAQILPTPRCGVGRISSRLGPVFHSRPERLSLYVRWAFTASPPDPCDYSEVENSQPELP